MNSCGRCRSESHPKAVCCKNCLKHLVPAKLFDKQTLRVVGQTCISFMAGALDSTRVLVGLVCITHSEKHRCHMRTAITSDPMRRCS